MSLPMDLTEKMLSREEKYTGAFLSVHVDQVSLPNGHTSFREVVEHVDGVAVLPLDERNNVITVSQYRYVFGKTLLEIPAGKLDPGEEPAVGALRELREETGLIPGVFESMGVSYSSPGILAERIYLYFAKDLKQGPAQPDDGEFVETVWIPYPELMDMARRGEIVDGKTLAGLLKASFLLGN